MRRYASQTSVSPEKSKMEIERTLSRYGAEQFMYGWKEKEGVLGFKMHDRMIRFHLPIPDVNEFRRQSSYEQCIRQRWRALALVVKAKLEAVESGITTFEEEFMAYIVLPNGQTMGQYALPQVAQAYETQKMPPLMLTGESK